MPRKVVDRDAYLAGKEAGLAKQIADTERTARQLRSELNTVAKERQDRERYVLGTLVQDAGLASVPQTELVRGFQQLAQFVTDPLVWGHFIHGDITREWIGPLRTAAIVDGGQEAVMQGRVSQTREDA